MSSYSDYHVYCPSATIDDPDASRIFVMSFVMAQLKDIKAMLMVSQVETLMIARHPTVHGFIVAMRMLYPVMTEDVREHIRAYKTQERTMVTEFECYTTEKEASLHSTILHSVQLAPSIFFFNENGMFNIGVDPRVTTHYEMPPPPRANQAYHEFTPPPISSYAEVLASRAFDTTRFP